MHFYGPMQKSYIAGSKFWDPLVQPWLIWLVWLGEGGGLKCGAKGVNREVLGLLDRATQVKVACGNSLHGLMTPHRLRCSITLPSPALLLG